MITATEVKGSVLWYDEQKRFGFIKRDAAPGLPKDAKDIFVHKDAVEAAGLNTNDAAPHASSTQVQRPVKLGLLPCPARLQPTPAGLLCNL